MTRISVLIPNYNRARLIGATLDNMLRQTRSPDEIIVVDDGSTDDSVAVIRSFGDPVHLIEQSNQGPGAARNRALDAATGDYIQFMDSDDLASLNKLEIQLAALEKSDADFAYCPWIRSEISVNKVQFHGPVLQGQALPPWKSMLEWQMGSWCLVFQNCLFRRQALDKAGQYRTDLMPTEDSEYLVRILLSGAKHIYTPNCIIFYRIGSEGQNQITTSGTRDKYRAHDRTHYLEIIGELVAKHLPYFQRSTQIELALDTYRHNRYCKKMGWPGTQNLNPITYLVNSLPPGYIQCFDYWDRLKRKLLLLPSNIPSSKGLSLRPIASQDKLLAQQAGFKILD